MQNDSLTSIVAVAFFSGLFGSVMGVVANHLLGSRKRAAEIGVLEAQTRHLNAETKRLESQATKMRDRQEAVEFLLKHLITGPELYFLKRIASEEEIVKFKDNFRDKEHLRQIRDAGYIEKTVDKNIGDLQRGQNLKQFFKITEKGREYLRYIAELES